MTHMKTAVVVLALMTAAPAHAQNQGADDGDLTVPKLVTIAACALIGGSVFYLVAEGLFADSVVVGTTVDPTPALEASDMAEHSGVITGLTIFGGTTSAILGGLGYDRSHSDVELAWSEVVGWVQATIQDGSTMLAWAGRGFRPAPKQPPQPNAPEFFPGGGV